MPPFCHNFRLYHLGFWWSLNATGLVHVPNYNYFSAVILDANRSDFEVNAELYAIEAFDRYKSDALTPYLDRKDKGIIL